MTSTIISFIMYTYIQFYLVTWNQNIMLLLIVCKPLKHIYIADIDLISPKFIFICNHGTKIDFAVFIFDFNPPPPPFKMNRWNYYPIVPCIVNSRGAKLPSLILNILLLYLSVYLCSFNAKHCFLVLDQYLKTAGSKALTPKNAFHPVTQNLLTLTST